jgi:hypothetical protein
MAALLMFILGLITIIGVARYNEDDNLFWKLFIAFIGSFTAATVVRTAMENDNKEKVVKIEKAPTQVLQSAPYNICTLADVSLAVIKREKSPKPVSKDSLINTDDSLLSEVHATMRGQPNFCMYYDDS